MNNDAIHNENINNGEAVLKIFSGFRYENGVRVETLNAIIYDADLIDEGPIGNYIFDAGRFTLAQAVEMVKARMAPQASSMRVA